ncbi:MAG: ABC transporter substrate-binding protein, partial [Conexivisphaerales archaeon]
MQLNKKLMSLSKVMAVIIIIVVLVIAGAAGYYAYTLSIKPSPTKTTIGPPNPNELVDMATAESPAPFDSLDPATGFYVEDLPVFSAVYQSLITYNGSSVSVLVPDLAKSWTSVNNGASFIFTMQPDAYFSNGNPINATTVWFSIYRTIIMGQGPGVANYAPFIASYYGPYLLPINASQAVQSVTGLPAVSDYNITARVLSQVLSNFNVHNSTIDKLMSYPDQAVVVLNSSTVEFHLSSPYPDFIYDLAAPGWGAMADPVFVDAHGGVQAGQANSYINLNGMVGSGPYKIVSVGSALSSVTLTASSNYWAANASGVPYVLKSPSIDNILVEAGPTTTTANDAFDSGQAQMIDVAVSQIGEVYSGYKYHQFVNLSTIMDITGPETADFYVSLNTGVFPTKNLDFREALAHAVNYTDILYSTQSYNGTLYGVNIVGPIVPSLPLYNPDKLPLYSYNVTLAEQYINESGYQEGFYVTLPSGQELGNTSASPLPTISIYTAAPLNPTVETEYDILQSDFRAIGVNVALVTVSPALTETWTTASAEPAIIAGLGWSGDWPDPVYGWLIPETDINYPGIFAGNPAFLNNTQLQQLYTTLPYEPQSQQVSGVATAYQIIYNEVPYLWMPTPIGYMFVAPYLHGVAFNPYTGYDYNLMYYSNYTAT